jgi:drug/metabolite transporter (DMT)-like permease
MSARSMSSASPVALVFAFAAIYLIWGSTYLAIRVGVETIPPFLMASTRFTLAGALLFTWCLARGAPLPTAVHWRSGAIVGGLLLCGGNGLVSWAEQWVPSGLASVLIAAVPLFMVAIDRFVFDGPRLTRLVLVGIGLGMVGILLLVSPGREEVAAVDLRGALALLSACAFWSIGSLYSRRALRPRSPLQATAVEMLAGGFILGCVSVATGEPARFDAGAVSPRSIAAWAYLVSFGSILGFSAYMWLLRVTTPAAVSTYAFVNPVVALGLGALVVGESLDAKALFASALVLGAVVCLHLSRVRRPSGQPPPANVVSSTGEGVRPTTLEAERSVPARRDEPLHCTSRTAMGDHRTPR